MSDFHFVAGQSALWAQVNGPNTQPVYLGCHEIGDITQPFGDVTLIYCPDESGVNKFKVVNSVQAAAGAVTTDVTSDVSDEIDSLERIYGSFTLFIHKIKKGRRDVFTQWDRSFVLLNARLSQATLKALAARTPDNNTRSEAGYSVSAEALLRPFRLTISRQSISETQDINMLVFCNERTDRTADSPAQESAQVGFAAAAFGVGAASNILKTTNGGTWTATAGTPFSTSENAISIGCFDLGRNQTRVISVRGTTDAGNPAEIAYSDDSGATWSNVNIGSVNAHFAPTRHSMWVRDRNAIWVGTNLGYIHKSSDAGLTWVTQDAGVIHSGVWNAIHFADALTGIAGGAANVLAKSLDGGNSWSAVTGPSAQAGVAVNVVRCLDRNRWWVGYANGKLYYTLDAGVNWLQRSFSGSGVGQIRDIKFMNELEGYLIVNNASPVGTVHQTIDGGNTWEALTTPTNAGLNAVQIGDEWKVFVAGAAQGGTGFIAKGIA